MFDILLYNPLLWTKSIYPGGEVCLRPTNALEAITSQYPKERLNLVARINNSVELVQVVLAVDILKRLTDAPIELELGYHPYGRQDKEEWYGFSLQAITAILDNLGLARITAFDCHSDVTAACYTKTKFKNRTPEKFIKHAVAMYQPDTIVVPDAGALKRLKNMIDPCYRIIQFYKTRDPKDGKLSNMSFVTGPTKPVKALVIDDICDGGATFIGIADKLLEAFPDVQLGLAVSHGIFSKEFGELDKRYQLYYTTNTIDNSSPTKLRCPNIAIFSVLPEPIEDDIL